MSIIQDKTRTSAQETKCPNSTVKIRAGWYDENVITMLLHWLISIIIVIRILMAHHRIVRIIIITQNACGEVCKLQNVT